jgi:hypothetical protein
MCCKLNHANHILDAIQTVLAKLVPHPFVAPRLVARFDNVVRNHNIFSW